MNAKQLSESALRLDNDVNGNPRYYIPVFCFWDTPCGKTRPFGAVKYRGKRYGQGWVFQSYNLLSDMERALQC